MFTIWKGRPGNFWWRDGFLGLGYGKRVDADAAVFPGKRVYDLRGLRRRPGNFTDAAVFGKNMLMRSSFLGQLADAGVYRENMLMQKCMI